MSNIQKINTEIKEYVSYIQKGGKLDPFLEDAHLISTELVGSYKFDNFEKLFLKFKKGDVLELFRDSKNDFDESAIIVKWENMPIGYIPGNHATILSNLMDAGKRLYALIDEVYEEQFFKNNFIKVVKISIFLKE